MSAKSRARGRFESAPEPDMTEDEQQQIADVMDAFETAEVNAAAGISKWVSAVFGARDRADTRPDPEKPAENMPENIPASRSLREPTPFERAILGGMARKPMYGGTVESWRVEHRRRRNRAARRGRRAHRLAARR